MSNETPPPGEPPADQAPIPPPVQQDWRTARDARRAERRAWREQRRAGRWSRGYGWTGGALLILLGVIFLLRNFGLVYPFNWWALFILIPAFGAFGAAWTSYSQTGRLGAPARGALIGGTVLTLIAAAFLFNLNWGLALPVLLILAGIAIVVNLMLPN